ncbi:MAG: hypothetical protein WCK35_21900 [Chloroflexota bacterium]
MADQPLAKRMALQKINIQMMLSPGGKKTSVISPSLSMLKAFTDFGGKKYLLAFEKMRTLDPAGLGSLRPGNILQPMIHSFQTSSNLLHIKPPKAGPSPWSKVETVFPSTTESQPEPATQPGEMHVGSIIPRMTSLPKIEPTQDAPAKLPSILPERKLPESTVPVQPRVAAKARLFSRVQEIQPDRRVIDDIPNLSEPSPLNDGQKDNVSLIPIPDDSQSSAASKNIPIPADINQITNTASDDTQNKPGVEKSANNPTTSLVSTPHQTVETHNKPSNTVQRQADPSPSSPSRPAASPKPETSSRISQPAPVPVNKAISQPQAVSPLSITPVQPIGRVPELALPDNIINNDLPQPVLSSTKAILPVEPDINLPQEIVTPINSNISSPIPETTSEKLNPQSEKPGLDAPQDVQASIQDNKPVTNLPPLAHNLEQPASLPLARPESVRANPRPTPEKQPDQHQASVPGISGARLTHPEDIEPPVMRSAMHNAGVQPPAVPDIPETKISQETEETLNFTQPAQKSILRQPLLRPETLEMSPVLGINKANASQVFSQLARPLVRPNKYQANQSASPLPNPAGDRIGLPFIQAGEQPSSPETNAAPAASAPLDFSLAYPASPQANRLDAAPTVSNPPAAKKPDSTPKNTEKINKSTEPALSPSILRTIAPAAPIKTNAVQNTIQRKKWPEHEGLGGSGVGSSPGPAQAEDSTQQAEIDLEQLADDVLPYIKRLIEQESDRISSRFRS